MFEGETTIKFSKEAAMLMMSQNVSAMFKMTLEVTEMDMTYSGLEITFGMPQEKILEKPESLPESESEPEETLEEKAEE